MPVMEAVSVSVAFSRCRAFSSAAFWLAYVPAPAARAFFVAAVSFFQFATRLPNAEDRSASRLSEACLPASSCSCRWRISLTLASMAFSARTWAFSASSLAASNVFFSSNKRAILSCSSSASF